MSLLHYLSMCYCKHSFSIILIVTVCLAKPVEHNRNKDPEMYTVQGKTRKDHIRNVIIQEKAHIKPINTFLAKETIVMIRSYTADR